MKNLHHWAYITLLAIFLCSIALPDSLLQDEDDEEEQVAQALLRPRNLYDRSPASSEGSSAGSWKYSRSTDTDFSVGFFITEDLNIQPASSEETPTLTTGNAESEIPLPVLSVRLGYKVASAVGLIAVGGVDFASGIKDPLAGVTAEFPIAKNFSSIATFTLSVPVSTASQNASRLTTLTAEVSPLYQRGPWFAGGNVFFSFYLYRGESSESDLGDRTNTRFADSGFSSQAGNTNGVTESENTTTGGSLYFGGDITNYLSANLALSTTNTYLHSGNFAWTTEATLARLTVSNSGFAGSAALSVLSTKADANEMSLPTQPFVGVRLQYVFGDQPALGVNRSESVPYVR